MFKRQQKRPMDREELSEQSRNPAWIRIGCDHNRSTSGRSIEDDKGRDTHLPIPATAHPISHSFLREDGGDGDRDETRNVLYRSSASTSGCRAIAGTKHASSCQASRSRSVVELATARNTRIGSLARPECRCGSLSTPRFLNDKPGQVPVPP